MRSLIDILELSVEEIDELILTAKDIIKNPKQYSKKCKGKKIATLSPVVYIIIQIFLEVWFGI